MKRTPLQRTVPLAGEGWRGLPRRPLPRQSKKRAALAPIRRRFVAEYLAAHPVCARCWSAPSTDVHEKQKRSRNPHAWLDESLVCALCRSCHEWTEAEPAAATEAGFLLPSWWKPTDTAREGRLWSA